MVHFVHKNFLMSFHAPTGNLSLLALWVRKIPGQARNDISGGVGAPPTAEGQRVFTHLPYIPIRSVAGQTRRSAPRGFGEETMGV